MAGNAEIVRSLNDPFKGINLAGIDWASEAIRRMLPGVYAEDVELRTLETGAGMGIDAHYVGVDGFVDYLSSWMEPFDEYYVDWLDYIEAGDFVLVPTRQWGTGATSGAKAELELTWLYELRDGLITRAFQYDTLEQARDAATQMQQS